ncbi:zinc-dependent metalloprotease [Brevibacterium senegalense]|uniref:zinc-dependent metalloprotease n=1 Tax=Brevibacterium senegalense TaxID=1033736 RepID=UPI0003050AEC|nr:zinc-dependent metalloprotease [Brevibacterium senegalense]
MSDKNDDRTPDDDDQGQNPFEQMFGMMFGSGGQGFPAAGGQAGGMPLDPSMLQGMLGQLQGLLSGGDSSAAAQKVIDQSVPTPDPTISPDLERNSTDAFRLAELWLERVIDPVAGTGEPRALNRAAWAKGSLDEWRRLADPIRKNMSDSMVENLKEQAPPEMAQLMAGAGQMLSSMSQSMFSVQIGEAVASLSGAVLSGTEFGLPLFGTTPVLVEANLPGAAAEMDVDATQLRIWLATRELAHLWLFAKYPWLRGHVETALAKYASGVEVDLSRVQDLSTGTDPAEMQRMAEELRSGMLAPATTDEQKEALTTLENLLSVIAGWSDIVVHRACEALEDRDAIREALRGRHASESEAEAAFASHIGFSLRPRRLRDAAALFTFLEQKSGPEARDAVFDHPDTLPTTQDLDDPLGYDERRQETWAADSSLDEALERILREADSGDSSRTDEPHGDDEGRSDERGDDGLGDSSPR